MPSILHGLVMEPSHTLLVDESSSDWVEPCTSTTVKISISHMDHFPTSHRRKQNFLPISLRSTHDWTTVAYTCRPFWPVTPRCVIPVSETVISLLLYYLTTWCPESQWTRPYPSGGSKELCTRAVSCIDVHLSPVI